MKRERKFEETSALTVRKGLRVVASQLFPAVSAEAVGELGLGSGKSGGGGGGMGQRVGREPRAQSDCFRSSS